MKNEKEIARLLIELGCPICHKGFRYMCDTLKVLLGNEDAIFNLSSTAYPAVARKYQSNKDCVEQNLRTMIKKCWSQQPEKLQSIALATLKYPPTIKEFLSILLVHLKYSI